MEGILHLPTFLATCLVVSATPGPATMFIVGRTVAQGRQVGVASVLGTGTGTLLHTVFAAAGLSAILATSAAAFTVVKLLGAAYLIFLGIRALVQRREVVDVATPISASPWVAFRQAFVTQALNPKLAVFMVSFLPQFVDGRSHGPVPFLVLGALFGAWDTVWFLTLVVLAARMTEAFRRNPRLMGHLQRASGVIYVALGLNLLRARPQVA